MAASPAAPVPAPPAVVPPAVPSGDNKKQGASPSPAVPKVEAGLSQEPKQAVSPEAEQKKPPDNQALETRASRPCPQIPQILQIT